MAAQMQININPGDKGSLTFDPPSLPVELGDQIFWTNNDENLPHWPGLKRPTDGSIDQTFFMLNQIAPASSSSIFSPGPPATDPVYRITEYELVYSCPDAKGDSVEGRIVVRSP